MRWSCIVFDEIIGFIREDDSMNSCFNNNGFYIVLILNILVWKIARSGFFFIKYLFGGDLEFI